MSERGKGGWRKAMGLEAIVLALSVVTFIAFGLAVDRGGAHVFFTTDNVFTLLRNGAVLGILGLAMSLVVIQRGIDLSLVAVMAVSSGWFLQRVENGSSMTTGLLLGLVLALAVGVWNGVASTYLEIPPLFSTLAASLVVYGLGRSYLMNLEVVHAPASSPTWFRFIGTGHSPILFFILFAIVMAIYLMRTRSGRLTYAIGDNPVAARLIGVAIRPAQVVNFMIAGVVAYAAGLVVASSVQSVNVRVVKSTLIYDVILVAVLGGIGLSGGRGRVWGVVASTILIATLVNGMTLLNFSLSQQNIVRGVLLLAAITADTLLHPRNEETAQQGDI